MMETALIQSLNNFAELELPEQISFAELKEKLTQHINDLIQNNFEKLLTLLYRIDVNEKKLKQLLQQNQNENAGGLIAQLIIERQLEKIKT